MEDKTEHGWLIEDAISTASEPLYFAGMADTGVAKWTRSSLKATRFSRKVDAESIDFGRNVRIAEHAWS